MCFTIKIILKMMSRSFNPLVYIHSHMKSPILRELMMYVACIHIIIHVHVHYSIQYPSHGRYNNNNIIIYMYIHVCAPICMCIFWLKIKAHCFKEVHLARF